MYVNMKTDSREAAWKSVFYIRMYAVCENVGYMQGISISSDF